MPKKADFTGGKKAAVVTRRQFVQQVAAIGALGGMTAALSGCAPIESVQPQAIQPSDLESKSRVDAGRARVAFIKTTDRTDGVRRAMALLGPTAWAGKSVLIKPNFNSADPAPGSTHMDVLRTVVAALQDAGSGEITIADRSGMGNTRSVMKQIGVEQAVEEMNCRLIALDELAVDDWETIEMEGSHWKQGFPFPRPVREVDSLVQLCCLKTHRYGGHFTMSLKNSVGLVAKFVPGDSYNYMNELHRSPLQRTLIAEINAAYAPDLVIMDGVEAFVRGGPANGDRVASNVMLAGTDRVALDAVGVALLRHFGTTDEVSQGAIFAQEQIARAVELGLGIAGPEQIELVTDDAESQAYAIDVQAVLRQG
jgi:uncharacterized protein (DUF362 family)